MSYVKVSRSGSGAWMVQLATKEQGRTVIIKHFGSAHTVVERQRLESLATQEKERPLTGQINLFDQPFDLSRVKVIAHRPEYFQRLIAHYYDLLGFRDLGPDLLFDLVLLRVYQPCSKLKSLRILESQFGRSYSFQAAYRLLDKLAEDQHQSKVRLQRKLHDAHVKHYGSPLTVTLYDVTTLYFESARDEDEYKLPGYSKDGKHKDPQILVGLLTNIAGFPLGYETFAGNTFEGGTLMIALSNWQAQFTKSKLRVIADAGMISKINVEKLTAAGFDFIVGARLKSLPGALTKELVDMKKQDGAISNFTYGGHKLIVSYSEKRARKDSHSIDKAVKKAKAIVDGEQTLKRRSKFVSSNESKKAVALNQAAIDQDRALAGLKGYLTNLSSVPETEIISQYRELIHVEQSFRMSKHDLRARPIFHHKEDSIKAHLLIVIMALAIGRLVEKESGQSVQKMVEQLGQALSYTMEDVATGARREQHPDVRELGLPESLAAVLLGYSAPGD